MIEALFPEDLRIIPNKREPDVRDSDVEFYCVLADPRFPEECQVKVLRPYTCPELDGAELLYGWTDGYNVYDHFERDIHDDFARVVAWKRI